MEGRMGITQGCIEEYPDHCEIRKNPNEISELNYLWYSSVATEGTFETTSIEKS